MYVPGKMKPKPSFTAQSPQFAHVSSSFMPAPNLSAGSVTARSRGMKKAPPWQGPKELGCYDLLDGNLFTFPHLKLYWRWFLLPDEIRSREKNHLPETSVLGELKARNA